MATYNPNESGELFEPIGPAPFDETKVGSRVECKACATPVISTQSSMRKHAETPKRLSDGSMGTCAAFWGVVADAN